MTVLFMFFLFVAGAYGAGARRVGDTCSVDGDCEKLAHSRCVDNKCTCNVGYYNSDSDNFCAQVTIHDPCPADGSGDAFCSAAVINSKCDDKYHYCTCLSGYGFVFTEPSTQECKLEMTGADCKTCLTTGGTCYDSNGDSIADTCGCKKYFTPSKPDSLTTGCDHKYTFTGGHCDKDGSIKCIDPNAECTQSIVDMSEEYICTCKQGFLPLFKPDNIFFRSCVSKINKEKDLACTVCDRNGGSCFDYDNDNNADGCECPLAYSSSGGLDTACDTNQAKLNCTASEMKMCINVILDYDQFTANVLKVFAQDYENDPDCNFAKIAGPPAAWCLSLRYNASKCGLKTVESTKQISFSEWFLLRVNGHRQMLDVFLYSYCSYDKIAHTYSGIQDMAAKKIVATAGLHLSPVLIMTITDKYGGNVELQGIKLFDEIKLEIIITDNQGVYTSLRAEFCLASNMLSLDHPLVQTSTFIIDACPVDSILSKLINFLPEIYDAASKTIFTAYFPAPKFQKSDFVFFHCAVKVCLEPEDCAPMNCPANRRRRSVGTIQTGPFTKSKRSLAGHPFDGAAGLTQTVVGCAVRDDTARGNAVKNPRAFSISQASVDTQTVELEELVEQLKKSSESDSVQMAGPTSNMLVVLCIIGSCLITLVIAVGVCCICFVLPGYRKGRIA